MTYNGWKNRETWLVNVYFGDNLAEDCIGFSADEIKDYVTSFYYDDERSPTEGLLGDFIAGCWTDVDWYELAEELKFDVDE